MFSSISHFLYHLSYNYLLLLFITHNYLLLLFMRSNVIWEDVIIIVRAIYDNVTCFYKKDETIRYIFRYHVRRGETLRPKSKGGILVASNQSKMKRLHGA